MDLDWGEQKHERTLQERGMDFASVAEADWDEALTVEDSRTDYGEARFVSLVPINERLCGFAALRLCGFAALRLYGFTALRLCGFAALRLCGFAALRLCGFAALRRGVVASCVKLRVISLRKANSRERKRYDES